MYNVKVKKKCGPCRSRSTSNEVSVFIGVVRCVSQLSVGTTGRWGRDNRRVLPVEPSTSRPVGLKKGSLLRSHHREKVEVPMNGTMRPQTHHRMVTPPFVFVTRQGLVLAAWVFDEWPHGRESQAQIRERNLFEREGGRGRTLPEGPHGLAAPGYVQ